MKNTYSLKENFESTLKSLFHKYKTLDFVVERGFVAHDQLECDSILFVGINPSYNEKVDHKNDSSFYNLLQENNAYQKYFRRFEDISKQVKHKWTHVDLFYFRHTNQKHVYHYLKHNSDTLDFVSEQLAITRSVLEAITPKVIVVSNALARDLFGVTKPAGLGINYSFDDEIGTHRIDEPNSSLHNVPLFFTSMLTGTRALDNGSYERLVWHLKRVLNTQF